MKKNLVSSVTDANGNASFTNVSAGTHQVVVNKQPYNQATQTINVVSNGQVFTVVLTSGGGQTYTITIHAQNQSGTALQGATVDLN